MHVFLLAAVTKPQEGVFPYDIKNALKKQVSYNCTRLLLFFGD